MGAESTWTHSGSMAHTDSKADSTSINQISGTIPDTNTLQLINTDDELTPTVKQVKKVNIALSKEPNSTIGDARPLKILEHTWKDGGLILKVAWNSAQSIWETLKDLKEDYPSLTAKYIVQNKVSRAKNKLKD